MSGRAFTWASAIWEQQPAICAFLDGFSGRAARKLIQHQQDTHTVADHAVDFRTLAAESAWIPEALFDMFLHGISEEVKDKLAAWELPTDLDSHITLTICIDERLRE
jgi:hypothetical protein